MKKNIHSRAVCFLLVLMLLMQNLAIPVHANEDGIQACCANPNLEVIKGYAPTCTEKGLSNGSQCLNCGKTVLEQIPIDPTGHAPATKSYQAPTCTEAGWTAGWVCENGCGYKEGVDEIPATGHTKEVTTQAKAPTCGEAGCTEGWKCKVCGYEEASQVIPATGHTKEVTTQAKAPTCGEAGCTEGWKCKVCGYSEASVPVPATNHTPAIDEAVPATCTAPGKTAGSHCSVCNTVLVAQTETPLADHTPAIDEAVPATCTTPGKTAGSHCSVCGVILTPQAEIPATGHTEAIDVGVPATCTTPGKTEGSHCSVCGVILTPQAEIPATGHTEAIDAGVPAACTTPGKTEGKHCSVCGETLKAQEHIPAKGHYAVIFPGYAPTCEEIGKENGLRCFTCGAVLEPRPEIPATGHQLVPVNDNPDNGFTCQVCGKTWAGLTQDGSYPLLPYEKEDNANGFRLSNGEAPAKSAHLQVYRNEEGNYVNVICLTWEDGTKSYVAFETGTANIGELLTIYLQNAKPAATRAKLEDASQPNFGVGFDESGNPYLYVVKDGTKYAFMVSEPVIETVEIVFGTKDLTTPAETQETQPIQKVEEQTEDQGITKIEDDSTDNTFVIQEYKENTGSNNFVRQPVTGFGREVQSSVCRPDEEVVVPRNGPSKFNLGIVDTADSECDKKGHTGFKYVNDETHRCSRCHGEELHSYVDGVCAVCNGKCKHSRWYASVENCLCYYCKTPKEHNFVEKDLGCECSDCGVYFPKHWFANGINSCVRCEAKCSHPSWTTENGIVVCSICRIRETHAWQERNGSCWCANCGLVLSHVYKDGSCTRCGAKCTHTGGWSNGTCKLCGFKCSHPGFWTKKNDNVCVCRVCGMEEAHHWRRFGAYYICSKCGAFSLTKKS